MPIQSDIVLRVNAARRALKVFTEDVEKSFDKQDREVKKSSKSIQGSVGSMFTNIRRIATGFAAFFAASFVGSTVRGLFSIGSSAEETRSKFGRVFGEMSNDVDAFVKNFVEKTNLTVKAGRDAAAVFGGLFAASGANAAETARLSQQALVLAGDLASFNDIDISEAIASLRSGLTGEAEPLKRFNVILREADVQTEALRISQKSLASQLTETDRVQARLSLTTKLATQQLGDLDKTADSAANTARRIQGTFARIREEIAVRFLPVWSDALRAIEENLPGTSASNKVGNFITTGIVAPLRKSLAFLTVFSDAWSNFTENLSLVWEKYAWGLETAFAKRMQSIVGIWDRVAPTFGLPRAGIAVDILVDREARINAQIEENLRRRVATYEKFQSEIDRINRDTELRVQISGMDTASLNKAIQDAEELVAVRSARVSALREGNAPSEQIAQFQARLDESREALSTIRSLALGLDEFTSPDLGAKPDAASSKLESKLKTLKEEYAALTDGKHSAAEATQEEIDRYEALIKSVESAIERQKGQEAIQRRAFDRLGPGNDATVPQLQRFVEEIGPTRVSILGPTDRMVDLALSGIRRALSILSSRPVSIDLEGPSSSDADASLSAARDAIARFRELSSLEPIRIDGGLAPLVSQAEDALSRFEAAIEDGLTTDDKHVQTIIQNIEDSLSSLNSEITLRADDQASPEIAALGESVAQLSQTAFAEIHFEADLDIDDELQNTRQLVDLLNQATEIRFEDPPSPEIEDALQKAKDAIAKFRALDVPIIEITPPVLADARQDVVSAIQDVETTLRVRLQDEATPQIPSIRNALRVLAQESIALKVVGPSLSESERALLAAREAVSRFREATRVEILGPTSGETTLALSQAQDAVSSFEAVLALEIESPDDVRITQSVSTVQDAIANFESALRLQIYGPSITEIDQALSNAHQIIRNFEAESATVRLRLELGSELDDALDALRSSAKSQLDDIRQSLVVALQSTGLDPAVVRDFLEYWDTVSGASSDAEKDSRKMAAHFSAIARSARSLLQLGEVFGDVSDQVRKLTSGIIELADSYSELSAAREQGLGLAAQLPGYIGIAASALTILDSVIDFDSKSIEEAVRENTRRIEKSIEELAAQAREAPDITGAESAAIDAQFSQIRLTSGLADGRDDLSGIRAEYDVLFELLQDAGFDTSALEDNLQAAIQQIAAFQPDIIQDPITGQLSEDWSQWRENMWSVLDQFDTSLQGVVALFDQPGAFNTDNPEGIVSLGRFLQNLGGVSDELVLDRVVAELQGLSGLSQDMVDFLSDILAISDPSSDEGREALQDLINAVAIGLSDQSFDLGNLSANQLEDLLSFLDGLAFATGSDGGTSSSASFNRSITEVQANLVSALLQTSVYWEERTAIAVEELVRLSSGGPSGNPSVPYTGPRPINFSGPVTIQAQNPEDLFFQIEDHVSARSSRSF